VTRLFVFLLPSSIPSDLAMRTPYCFLWLSYSSLFSLHSFPFSLFYMRLSSRILSMTTEWQTWYGVRAIPIAPVIPKFVSPLLTCTTLFLLLTKERGSWQSLDTYSPLDLQEIGLFFISIQMRLFTSFYNSLSSTDSRTLIPFHICPVP